MIVQSFPHSILPLEIRASTLYSVAGSPTPAPRQDTTSARDGDTIRAEIQIIAYRVPEFTGLCRGLIGPRATLVDLAVVGELRGVVAILCADFPASDFADFEARVLGDELGAEYDDWIVRVLRLPRAEPTTEDVRHIQWHGVHRLR